jgi:hypothetical protein
MPEHNVNKTTSSQQVVPSVAGRNFATRRLSASTHNHMTQPHPFRRRPLSCALRSFIGPNFEGRRRGRSRPSRASPGRRSGRASNSRIAHARRRQHSAPQSGGLTGQSTSGEHGVRGSYGGNNADRASTFWRLLGRCVPRAMRNGKLSRRRSHDMQGGGERL